MIKIQLNEHTTEDYKSIEIARQLGFSEEEIQKMYDKQQESDNEKN